MLLKWQMISAGIEVVTDKKDFQWMKEQIDEINITLDMFEEKPLQMQFNEKKEIENLSTSDNDTQARSQSLKPKIILDSSNSQEFINNLNFLSNTKNKIDNFKYENKSSIKNGKVFLYFETRAQFISAEINNGKIRILPQTPSLADLTESRPIFSNIAQNNDLSSSQSMVQNGKTYGFAYE